MKIHSWMRIPGGMKIHIQSWQKKIPLIPAAVIGLAAVLLYLATGGALAYRGED